MTHSLTDRTSCTNFIS